MRRSAATVVLAALVATSTANAESGVVKVIPPGLEATIGDLVGVSESDLGGCAGRNASIDRTKIVAKYACNGQDAFVELHHPTDATAPRAKTEQFALVTTAPQPLVDALAARLRAKEHAFRWVSAEAPGLGVVADGPTAPTVAPSGFTPEQSEAFVRGAKLYREGHAEEAFEAFRKLAREEPHNGVLGMLVASLASTPLTLAEVDAYGAEADRAPSDPLAQFVAGVSAHYRGHRHGKTREEKLGLYARAIRHLERARPAFDFEPRVFVYLAVSHYRLGHQAEAEQLIEKAIPLATNDPDVYYCRGEIQSQKDVARAIADVRRYLEMTDALTRQGVVQNEAKHERVRKMLAHLEAVQAGKAKAMDLFDPLPDPPHEPPPPAHAFFRTPRTFALATLGASGVGTLVWLGLARRRRRAT